eukprot:m.500683 g.500683  ORF g.500683 m.500683 type:complete len:78 (+) comp21835_c0_seq8:1046-1279(+)
MLERHECSCSLNEMNALLATPTCGWFVHSSKRVCLDTSPGCACASAGIFAGMVLALDMAVANITASYKSAGVGATMG